MQIDGLIESMQTAAIAMEHWPSASVQLFHHNDADGLSSAAILSTALARKGYRVQRYCLEKPYPQVLQHIFEHDHQIIIFADFAARIAPLLADLNHERNLILILDHHSASSIDRPCLHNLNPELYGMKGDRDISASTTCYLFAKVLDEANTDLAYMAVVGAVGDQFHGDGQLTGPNRQALLDACKQDRLTIQTSRRGERYRLRNFGNPGWVHEIVSMIETLGAAGYYQGGPELGIELVVSGVSHRSRNRYQAFNRHKTRAFNTLVHQLERGGLMHTDHIQWFQAGDGLAPMGVKMIGVFCQFIRPMDFIDPQKYIAGFQHLPNVVPGFGSLEFNADKVSMRVPPLLGDLIQKGEKPGLDTFFPQATNQLGGFSDGCHRLAAATTVGRGNEKALIREMDIRLGQVSPI